MSDPVIDPLAAQAADRYDVSKIIVISGWAITLAVVVITIMASLYLMFMGHEVPSPLKEWGGMAYGFLFGNLATLIMNFALGKTS